jgi:hypothetical protein
MWHIPRDISYFGAEVDFHVLATSDPVEATVAAVPVDARNACRA